MKLENLIREKRADILKIAAMHGARNVRLFGSVARGESKSSSDVDLLIDLAPDRSLLDLSGMLLDLQDLLHRKVDVVTQNGLHWYIRDRVLKEAVPL